MFFLRSPVAVDVRELLPGVMALSILFGTTSMLAVTITFERKSRSFERLLLAPISLNLLMLAKTSGAIMFGVFNAFVPVIFASFMTDLSGINWLMVLLLFPSARFLRPRPFQTFSGFQCSFFAGCSFHWQICLHLSGRYHLLCP